jgi:hypothetical protein
MKSRDVAALYAQVPLGAIVEIIPDRLPKVPAAPRGTVFTVEAPKPRADKADEETSPEKAPESTARKSVDTEEQPHFGRGA